MKKRPEAKANRRQGDTRFQRFREEYVREAGKRAQNHCKKLASGSRRQGGLNNQMRKGKKRAAKKPAGEPRQNRLLRPPTPEH